VVVSSRNNPEDISYFRRLGIGSLVQSVHLAIPGVVNFSYAINKVWGRNIIFYKNRLIEK